MNKLYLLYVFSILFNCSVQKKKQENILKIEGKCIENLTFKDEYFHNIKEIDSLIYKWQNQDFKKSLLFISKYSHVSAESMLNYGRTYPGGVYEEDRKGWIIWYEENKCKNIQFKKSGK